MITVENNLASLHSQLTKSRHDGVVMAGGMGPDDANMGTTRSSSINQNQHAVMKLRGIRDIR